MLPSDRLLSLLLHIVLACSLHPGFARVVSFDRTRVTSARRSPSNSVNVRTPSPTSIGSPIDRKPDNASYLETSEETMTMPVPVLDRLSFVPDTRRPRPRLEPDSHVTSWRRDTAAHVAFVVTGSATGGFLVVAVVAAILYVIRCHCARAAEDEQVLLPGSAENSSPVDNKPLLDSILASEVDSCRASHGVAFVPTGSDDNIRTACHGSCSTTLPWLHALRSYTTDPDTKPDPGRENGLPTSTVTNQTMSISRTMNGTEGLSDRGVYVIVPRGALGDNTSTTVTLRTLGIAANKLVSSAGQIQHSSVFQCAVPGVVELHKAIVIRIPRRTFAPRGWRLGVLYRDVHRVGGTRWKYADQLDGGCRTSDVGGRSSEQSYAGQDQQPKPRRHNQLDNECVRNEDGVRNSELSPEPHSYDQMPRPQRPPCEQLQEPFRPNENQQQQQQQHNSDVLYTYDDEYVSIQTRHLTAVVCVAWPPSAGTT